MRIDLRALLDFEVKLCEVEAIPRFGEDSAKFLLELRQQPGQARNITRLLLGGATDGGHQRLSVDDTRDVRPRQIRRNHCSSRSTMSRAAIALSIPPLLMAARSESSADPAHAIARSACVPARSDVVPRRRALRRTAGRSRRYPACEWQRGVAQPRVAVEGEVHPILLDRVRSP